MNSKEMAVKEVKNGRLAMVGVVCRSLPASQLEGGWGWGQEGCVLGEYAVPAA